MKKELLLATTIAGVALGATSASAVTSSISGNHRVGLLDVDKDSSNATSHRRPYKPSTSCASTA